MPFGRYREFVHVFVTAARQHGDGECAEDRTYVSTVSLDLNSSIVRNLTDFAIRLLEWLNLEIHGFLDSYLELSVNVL